MSVSALPAWLLSGLAIGGLATLLIAGIFVVGARMFPPGSTSNQSSNDGGEYRRRSEIRTYLRSINEPFHEDFVIQGQSVAFFLPEREVAITFDAPHYFVLNRLGVQAILVEYEMPGHQLSHRLPFETPSTDRGVGDFTVDEPGLNRSAWSVLGISSSASVEEVRTAYRDRVKDVHPDHGGSVEEFTRLREAYVVAKEWAE